MSRRKLTPEHVLIRLRKLHVYLGNGKASCVLDIRSNTGINTTQLKVLELGGVVTTKILKKKQKGLLYSYHWSSELEPNIHMANEVIKRSVEYQQTVRALKQDQLKHELGHFSKIVDNSKNSEPPIQKIRDKFVLKELSLDDLDKDTINKLNAIRDLSVLALDTVQPVLNTYLLAIDQINGQLQNSRLIRHE